MTRNTSYWKNTSSILPMGGSWRSLIFSKLKERMKLRITTLASLRTRSCFGMARAFPILWAYCRVVSGLLRLRHRKLAICLEKVYIWLIWLASQHPTAAHISPMALAFSLSVKLPSATHTCCSIQTTTPLSSQPNATAPKLSVEPVPTRSNQSSSKETSKSHQANCKQIQTPTWAQTSSSFTIPTKSKCDIWSSFKHESVQLYDRF